MENLQGSLVGAVHERTLDPDEVDRIIERRATRGEDADEREETWKESVRQYHAEHREARRRMWITYYRRLSGSHRRLSDDLESKARLLEEVEA